MSKIERLRYIHRADKFGIIYGSIPPSKEEIVGKINEIIEWINKHEGGEE